jgi:hypothetical protein
MTDLLRPPDSSDPPPEAVRQLSRKGLVWMITGGVALFAMGAWLVVSQLPRWLASPADGDSPAAAAAAQSARKIQATLFYVSEDGMQLVPTNRDVPYGATPGEQARRIVEVQVQAPPDGAMSAIPAGTTVRSVFLTPAGEAFVDLGGAIASGHTGGTQDEALAVYAIVDALTINLPDITGVQILIDGKEVDTLAGHVDLRYPLAKSLDWVRKGS